MSAYKNENMPGIRQHAGQVFITKKDIKEIQPRQQIVDERKAADAAKPGAAKPADAPKA